MNDQSETAITAREHPHAEDRRTFQVGFFAWVEVEAFDEGEASLVAEAALHWPGSWAGRGPVESEGTINGYRVTARITRTQALTVAPVDSGSGGGR